MTERLAEYMRGRGYQVMVTNVRGLIFLFRQEMQSVNVVIVMEWPDGVSLPLEQYRQIKEQMRDAFERRGVGELHALGLLVTNEPEAAAALRGEDPFFWLIDRACGRLLIGEHQAADFYGLKGILEAFLLEGEESGAEEYAGAGAEGGNGGEMPYAESAGRTDAAEAFGGDKRGLRERLRGAPVVTALLVAVNCAVFLMYTWSGEVLYNNGELLASAVAERGEYYRILTSMFMHADTGHLFGNMLMLYALGAMLEQRLGHIRYAFLYGLSGAGAAAASMWHQFRIGSLVGSIGASGAVYGLIGALFFLVIAGKGRFESVTFPRVLLCIAYSLYSGMTAENIDNAAHIGGLICGFAVTALMMIKSLSMNGDKKGTDKT